MIPIGNILKRIAAPAASALFALSVLVPGTAFARTTYVDDGAGMFSAATVTALDAKIAAFNQQTGKEIVVVTVPSLSGTPLRTAVENAFAQRQVNGVLFFIAKAERQDAVVGDQASRAFFPAGSFGDIHDAMRAQFRAGDFDGGITTGVNLVLDGYRGHLRSNASGVRPTVPVPAPATTSSFGGIGLFWLILTLLAGFMIIRAIFRAFSGPRMMPPGYGGPGYGGPGYGGPGYGPMGYGGGGGGFFSGLLGGLGGAFIGNELFGRGGGFGGGNVAGVVPPDASAPADQSGWQPDPGQADMSGMGGGDWGGGGGGADWGGGGGGDFGGGGDSGGGGW